MSLFAIKVGTGDGAGQQIVQADSPGLASGTVRESLALILPSLGLRRLHSDDR